MKIQSKSEDASDDDEDDDNDDDDDDNGKIRILTTIITQNRKKNNGLTVSANVYTKRFKYGSLKQSISIAISVDWIDSLNKNTPLSVKMPRSHAIWITN